MKHAKRMLVVLLMALLVVALALLANAEGATIVDSGYCGNWGNETSLTWTLDSEGALTISGEGKMGSSSFEGRKDIKSIIIGDEVTEIEADAFEQCINLVNVKIGNRVTFIGTFAFFGCSSLKSIIIPDSTEWIGEACFAYCHSLRSISLGNGLIGLGREAFLGCGFDTIELPASLKYICSDNDDYIDSDESNIIDYGYAFLDSYLLSTIKVAASNPYYTSVDGCLYSKDQSVFIKYPEAKKGDTYIVPAQVKTINAYAFHGNDYLKELVIPKTVQTIYPGAFSDCINLKKVYILNPACTFSAIGNLYGGVVSSNSTTIYGYSGSTAETVSLLNNCRFEVINDSNLHGSGTTSEPTTQPTTKPTTQPATEADEQSTDEETEENLNFFQRIIQWFKNLFAKLFGR